MRGILKNEAENMYGTDKFDTRWFGLGLKGGYNYALRNSWALQLNVYAGYTYVKSEDYTSKSGIKINRDSLNLLEIDPGFKLSTQFGKDWTMDIYDYSIYNFKQLKCKLCQKKFPDYILHNSTTCSCFLLS